MPERTHRSSAARCSPVSGNAGVRFMRGTVANPSGKYKKIRDQCTSNPVTQPPNALPPARRSLSDGA